MKAGRIAGQNDDATRRTRTGLKQLGLAGEVESSRVCAKNFHREAAAVPAAAATLQAGSMRQPAAAV